MWRHISSGGLSSGCHGRVAGEFCGDSLSPMFLLICVEFFLTYEDDLSYRFRGYFQSWKYFGSADWFALLIAGSIRHGVGVWCVVL